jgi:uncharacterized protein YdhG (YjbR/CyaY superfamily)
MSAKQTQKAGSFTDEEKAAMKERVKELKAEERRAARGEKARAEGERDIRAKIAEMGKPARAMAERIHAIVSDTAPELVPRTWYGMPAYEKDEKVLCFFRPAEKFKTRYATFGFSDKANLDDGPMWPTDFAVKELNAAAEKRLAELVKRAVS